MGLLGARLSLPERPAPGARTRVQVELKEGLGFRGQVEDGPPDVEAWLVRARRVSDENLGEDPSTWPRRGTTFARVKADGGYVLGIPEPGQWMIGLTCETRRPVVVGPLEVRAGDGMKELDLGW